MLTCPICEFGGCLRPLKLAVDKNKRTAFVTSVTYLRLCGWHFVTEPAAGVGAMEGLTSDQISEDKFQIWLTQGSTALT